MDKELQSLGLSKNESKIYCLLVKKGRSSISEISRSIKVDRRNVYDAIHRIQERGLVTKIYKSKETIYEAVHPNKLQELLRAKERILDSILPELNTMYQSEAHEEEIYIYKGKLGFKNNMAEILEVKETVYTIGAKGLWFDEKVKGFTKDFLVQAKKLKIEFKHIFDYDVKTEYPEVLKQIPKPHRFFPEKFETQASVVIYGNRVVTFTGVEPGNLGDDITVFVLVNRAVANAYKKWFSLLWKLLA